MKFIHISNLRPYHTITDEDAVVEDEYLVEELLRRRGSGAKVEYLVKWRGYPRSESTWEPENELSRRCADLIAEFKPKATAKVKKKSS
eukprot:scaffold9087_cov119-Isochrysis_galbana.AAC.10